MPAPTGIVDKNQANKSEGHHIHNYSTFDRSLSYRLYNTHRFGEYTPTFVMEGVPNDEISLNSYDGLDSLSLKAPFKGSIRKIKESFMVPNMAILPLQWDRIYAQNTNGDDVPQDANCVISNFPTLFKNLWSACFTNINTNPLSTASDVNTYLTGFLRLAVLGEYVYSSGSLLNVLGYKANSQIRIMQNDSKANALYDINYDRWFDDALYFLFEDISSVTVIEPVGGTTRQHRFQGLAGNYFEGYEEFRSMIELFRENPLCYFTQVNFSSSTTLSAWTAAVINNISGAYTLLNLSSFIWYLPSNTAISPE